MRKLRLLAWIIISIFLINVVAAAAQFDVYGIIPSGVTAKWLKPLTVIGIDNGNYSNLLDPAIKSEVINESQYRFLGGVDKTEPGFADLVRSVYNGHTQTGDLTAKASSADILGSYTPAHFADYMWHYHPDVVIQAASAAGSALNPSDQQYNPNLAAAGATPADAVAFMQENPTLMKAWTVQYEWGIPVDCESSGNAAVCNTGVKYAVQPAGRFWTPAVLSAQFSNMAARGESEQTMIEWALGNGFDLGTSINALAEANANPGTVYAGTTHLNNLDPTVYGDHPLVATIYDPTWTIVNTGQGVNSHFGNLVVQSQGYGFVAGTAGTTAITGTIEDQCGGANACGVYGGGTSNFIIPTDVITQMGSGDYNVGLQKAKYAVGLISDSSAFWGPIGGNPTLLVFDSEASMKAWSGSQAETVGCAVNICMINDPSFGDASYTARYNDYLLLSTDLNAFAKAHPDWAAGLYFGNVPINSAFPSVTYGGQLTSPDAVTQTLGLFNPSNGPLPTPAQVAKLTSSGKPLVVGGPGTINGKQFATHLVYLYAQYGMYLPGYGCVDAACTALTSKTLALIQFVNSVLPGTWTVDQVLALSKKQQDYKIQVEQSYLGAMLALQLGQEISSTDPEAAYIPWNNQFASALANGKLSMKIPRSVPACIGCESSAKNVAGLPGSNAWADIATEVGGYGPSYQAEWTQIQSMDAATLTALEGLSTKQQFMDWYHQSLTGTDWTGTYNSPLVGYLQSQEILQTLANPACGDLCIQTYVNTLKLCKGSATKCEIGDTKGNPTDPTEVVITITGGGGSTHEYRQELIPIQMSATPFIMPVSQGGGSLSFSLIDPNSYGALSTLAQQSSLRPFDLMQQITSVFSYTFDEWWFPLALAWYWLVGLLFAAIFLVIDRVKHRGHRRGRH